MGSLKALDDLAHSVREEQDALADDLVDLRNGEQRFLDASTSRGVRRASRWARYGLAAAAAAALVSVVALWSRREPLHFTVGKSEQYGETSAWFAAPPAATLPLRFSDGTEWTLGADARGRVAEVREHGATLVLENGSSTVRVRHKSGADWKVELGPFRVKVTGTRFDVSWNQATEEFFLALYEGRVVIAGCVFGEGRVIQPEEIVHASCREGRMEITKSKPRSTVSASPGPAKPPAVPAPDPGMRGETPDPGVGETADAASRNPNPRAPQRKEAAPLAQKHDSHKSTAAPTGDWRELARQGRHREAVAAAEAAGFSAQCQGAQRSDLMALGDAARFVGRLGRATEAYSTLRSRFPGDTRAAVAAFALGRVAFDQRRDFAAAARWFRTYLLEMPGGRLARDARGRLMESLSRAGNAAAARKEAVRYLEQYPSGPHADMARQLQSQ